MIFVVWGTMCWLIVGHEADLLTDTELHLGRYCILVVEISVCCGICIIDNTVQHQLPHLTLFFQKVIGL